MIAEFILARVAEDEAVARMADAGPDSVEPWALGTCDFGPGCAVEVHPARVLRQCEAIRRVVERSTVMVGTERATTARRGIYDVVERRMALDDACEEVLAALAAIWSDHPDYRAEWAA